MGLLDHNKTWHFLVAASEADCLGAFASGLGGQSSLSPTKTKWSVRRAVSSEGHAMAVASYEGRGGVAGAMTMLSENATAEQSRAEGSQLTFEITEMLEEQTQCAMWLSLGTRTLGFQNDGRFFRSAMRSVERSLRSLDSGMRLRKV